MTTAQRAIVFFGLLGLGCALHMTFLEWRYKAQVRSDGRYDACLRFYHGRSPKPGSRRHIVSGVWPEDDLPRPYAVTLGAIVPVTLFAAAACCAIGWRHARRRQFGLCHECGYDLRGNRAEGEVICPECGSTAHPAATAP